ncbi:hypothetical protein SAMN05660420_02089 [Desulfuromusa kysingii]|uniref:Polysaccharide pyruvyl transferase n=1 Tax=Desulfuromusa kysingii TaxID=37625 RepID=A0A1H4B9K5_9BACT|nr:hypothetical protein [Desulfuromusa kysingii]SEA44756.1 hypothetical protein SAMN05660420_02089 [Desulfuromusa kysingii]
MSKLKVIGIFGHYGNKKIEDETFILSVIQNLYLRIPNVEIECFSINSIDSSTSYNMTSYPIWKEKVQAVIVDQTTENPDHLQPQNKIIVETTVSEIHQIKNVFKKIPFVFTFLEILQNLLELPLFFLKEFENLPIVSW